MTNSYQEQARRFRSLHRPGEPLVLPNAWDAASARLIAQAGATAIATTSAAVAWSAGASDGGALGPERALDLIARVAAAVGVPVTADIEDGYAADPAGVGGTIRRVRDAGAVGVNLEDGRRPVAEHAARNAAARKAGGPALFVNARVDTYLLSLGDPATRLRDTLERAAAYVAAGADGIFVPGVADPDPIAALAAGIPVPLNVMAGPGSPSVGELAGLGVARVSVGPAIALAAYAAARRAARELLAAGSYRGLDGALDFAELDGLMAADPAVTH
ncbi:isocitrate lyase/phosphoenolpyruvate mutase family protein [Micromonospora sp. PLK6-60]|uniref:isocitrate lyase/PEP mutase family protein n=1 Tax=Micromonospora sp. PLK6-60 TaxID=2873383 RepID=UPI001CA6AB43|nr:isocitrate lyase/phosphoenolpyruvate mutase family protein [Micromonospora sp. PLK6-60]MBY8875991.1 isocitrate lyase/phosphoenolpyruvate mutase family protein [Micromonospora sp. PLK6-60]